MKMLSLKLLILFFSSPSFGLDNGLGLTPPMGWISWERFRCNTDCLNDPDNCIGEKLFMDMADRMVADGFKDVGYEYIIIDDCWLNHTRDENHQLQPNHDNFPNGIKALADYIHNKGLKFGIYEDFGTKTCGGYPGSEYYLQLDAQTFADWGVDYLKLDGCHSSPSQYDDAYPAMSMWLNYTGRPMVFSCSWPAYQGGKSDYAALSKYCNIWRNFGDISDSWQSLSSIINIYGKNEFHFAEAAGPGHFNDPDMLILGNFGLSHDQERVQMGMWAIMASPLIMSNDLRAIRDSSKQLLTNKAVISINQDKLGKQGTLLIVKGSIQVWTKPLSDDGIAFAILNMGKSRPSKVNIKLSDLGLKDKTSYRLTEVFDGVPVGVFVSTSIFSTSVNPSGIYLVRAVPF